MTTVASRKAKGRKAQQLFRDMMLEWAGDVLDPADLKSVSMGETGSDIYFSPAALDLFSFDSVEVKCQERLNVWAALQQMEAHGKRPILAFKRNRSEMYVCMKASDFFDII